MKRLIGIVLGLIVAQLASSALAQQPSAWQTGEANKLSLLLGPYTYHFTYDPEHKEVLLLGVEREYPDARLDGITVFTNSFGQPSAYLYPWGGAYHAVGGIRGLSFKWTAGILYGYVAPYQDKVPLNYKGFSPAVIPSLAYEFTPGWSGQLNLLGNNALMFQLSVALN